MLEDTLLENSELKKKIEKLEDKIRNQEDKIKSLEEKKDKYKKEAAAAKGLKIREGLINEFLERFYFSDNFDENRQKRYESIRTKYGMKDPNAPNPFDKSLKYLQPSILR